ncbi:FkbM family methyltransferase [Hyunsoonleella flava]|nr:FkbM family methyltransferase [Hyunsoonleella flava]
MNNVKGFFYKFLPKSFIEIAKLKYYNFQNRKYVFSKELDNYHTSEEGKWNAITKKPLYFLVHDIDKYEKYYKIEKDNVVFDAGANEGALSIIYSQKVGVRGKVFSFEPDSVNTGLLKKNLDLNTEVENIDVVKKGLWNKSETLQFFEAGNVGSSIFYEDEKSKQVTIQGISIDDFVELQNLNKLDFIKMDIEGAEIKALEGAVKTIEKLKPNFAIASYHMVDKKLTYIAVERFFKHLNYPFKTEFFDDGEIIVYAGNSVK